MAKSEEKSNMEDEIQEHQRRIHKRISTLNCGGSAENYITSCLPRIFLEGYRDLSL